jgi:hypothetical protein
MLRRLGAYFPLNTRRGPPFPAVGAPISQGSTRQVQRRMNAHDTGLYNDTYSRTQPGSQENEA